MGKPTVWLDNSRIVAMLAVVALHVATIVMAINEIGSVYWWFGNIYNSLVRWCVPVFVMISGSLLLDPYKQEDLLTFYRKRAARVLIPITTWSMIFLGWRLAKGTLQQEAPTAVELLQKLASGTPYEHMWFLYMILGLYLLTPFFRKLIYSSTDKELNFLIVIAFALAAINHIYASFIAAESKLFVNWFLLYVPFFFLGHRIRDAKWQPSHLMLWSTFLLSSTATAIGCYLLALRNSSPFGLYFYGYLSLTVIPMSVSIMYLLKNWQKPILSSKFTKKLSLLTLGIYLIHPIFLEIMLHVGFFAKIHPSVSIPVISSFIFIAAGAGAWTLYRIPYLKRVL